MRWTRKSIIAEIQKLHNDGAELNYASAETNHLNLMRAAAWHFGSWRRAIEQSGIDYEDLSKYRRWDKDRIIERIRELHREDADLSWRSVSLEVDPALAAAALRPNGFASWREAIAAAGLDIHQVARYQHWSEDRVLHEIRRLSKTDHPLSSKVMQSTNQPLFCAARRRFGSWDEALEAAGLDVSKIRLRQPSNRTGESNGIAAGLALLTSNGHPHPGRGRKKKVVEPIAAAPSRGRKATLPATTTAKFTALKTAASKTTASKTAAPSTAKNSTAKTAATKVASVPTSIKKTTAGKTAASTVIAPKATATKTLVSKAIATKAVTPGRATRRTVKATPITKTATPKSVKAEKAVAPVAGAIKATKTKATAKATSAAAIKAPSVSKSAKIAPVKAAKSVAKPIVKKASSKTTRSTR